LTHRCWAFHVRLAQSGNRTHNGETIDLITAAALVVGVVASDDLSGKNGR
jgi:hypothetical protein